MTRVGIDSAPLQEIQSLIQSLQQCLRREDIEARCGKFNRQRQAIQPDAQFGNRAYLVLIQIKIMPHGAGALDKQSHRRRF
jgi:hypothetical protein